MSSSEMYWNFAEKQSVISVIILKKIITYYSFDNLHASVIEK